MPHHPVPGDAPLSRRTFLGAATRTVAGALLVAVAGDVLVPARLASAAAAFDGKHPDPRPGIDASRILPTEKLADRGENVVAAFDDARRIPEILDGIRCHCGCAEDPEMRSLLTCYEGDDPMAALCKICQGQARLAYRLHRGGRTLDQIRAAIDARYD